MEGGGPDGKDVPANLTDEQIVERVLGGDDQSFAILMQRYNQRLYRAARSILRDDTLAEDVIQQAYINAYFHLGQYAGRARFSTWLTRIAINEALARVRSESSDRTSALNIEQAAEAVRSNTPNPERQALGTELIGLVEAAIDGLPQPYRMVFVLREVEGLSTSQAADHLDVGIDVVKTRLLRARRLLRSALGSHVRPSAATAFQFRASRCVRLRTQVPERIARRAARSGSL